MDWIQTFIEERYFPFYEVMWLFMIVLWWSVIVRLKRIEDNQGEIISEIVNEGD